ncbi:MAG: GEVED domain-containing protein [Thermonemataceae bacterium]|nr:GEVED domain-containing protein [Thermonemataceae bacterium]
MKKILSIGFAALLATASYGQRVCHSMEVLAEQKQHDHELEQRMNEIERVTENYIRNGSSYQNQRVTGTVTIPVVVHVIYNSSKTQENISAAQIQSQIDVLNEDYRKLNADRTKVPSLFSSLASDTEIQFVLATTTPTGAATTGITRKSSTKTSWGTNDAMKKSSQGGVDPWDATRYLNIWVCNIGNGILGYAQFPGGSTATDGVVISPQYFGSSAKGSGFYLSAPFDKGRTGTHEVGHWLNLRHIWGDASCGNDFVTDTPTQQTSNYGCPTFPKASCSNTSDMFMNYMDYTDDACMYMFSTGQKDRMRATFETGGGRSGFVTSGGGTTPPPTTPTYCTSKGNSVADEWIQRVQLGSINNTSGANAGYGNFTAQSTSLVRGTSNTITITPGWKSTKYSEGYAVWIDYNRDGDFADAGEQLFTVAKTTTTPISRSFTVPTSVTAGSTRMRVSMKYNGTPTSCETFSYGEVEDYTVNIVATREDGSNQAISQENFSVELYPNPATTSATIRLAGNDGETNTVQIFDMAGRNVYSANVESNKNHELDLSRFEKGLYLINISTASGVVERKKLVVQK